jgi:hypothetical protein
VRPRFKTLSHTGMPVARYSGGSTTVATHMTLKESMTLGLQCVSLTTAAQIVLARVATNLGQSFGVVLDIVAQELCECMPIYGRDGRTKTYRAIRSDELRGAVFKNGALILNTADGGVFTQLTLRRSDLNAYLTGLDRMDVGAWAAAQGSLAVFGKGI